MHQQRQVLRVAACAREPTSPSRKLRPRTPKNPKRGGLPRPSSPSGNDQGGRQNIRCPGSPIQRPARHTRHLGNQQIILQRTCWTSGKPNAGSHLTRPSASLTASPPLLQPATTPSAASSSHRLPNLLRQVRKHSAATALSGTAQIETPQLLRELHRRGTPCLIRPDAWTLQSPVQLPIIS